MIFAWGESEPAAGSDISYHFANRGSTVVAFKNVNQNQATALEDDLEKITFTTSDVHLTLINKVCHI